MMIRKVSRFIKNIRLHDEAGAKGKVKQIREIILLALKHGFSPLEYESYGFYLAGKQWQAMLSYLSNSEITYKLRPALYDKSMVNLLNNKLLFNRYYGSFGLPLPKFYGFFNPASGFTQGLDSLRTEEDIAAFVKNGLPAEFVVKPIGGMQGKGIVVVESTCFRKGSPVFTDVSGREWTAKELFAAAPGTSYGHKLAGFILEEKIKQHPVVGNVNASSVNTCRLLSIYYPDGTIDIPFGLMKFGRQGMGVDNWAQGGLAASIDTASGILGKGTYAPVFRKSWTSYHPDSNVKVEGFKLPLWEEALSITKKAAAVTPGIKSVGWDLAFGEKGPVIIEGNSSWGPIFVQTVNGGFLTPDIRSKMRQFGLTFR